MLRHVILLLFCCLSILSGCNSDDQSSQEDNNLVINDTNLQGDWKRTAQYIGPVNDSLGILMPTEDLFSQFEACRKDDIIRYQKGDEQTENIYFWGIGEVACHSQIAGSFVKIGTWNLQETGELNHFYSNVTELFIVVKLQSQQLLIRKKSGMEDPDGVIYEFTGYERIE